jgi:hypothetical protein
MLDKIRKLLAMAEHPNTNPAEAANAAAMAAALAAKHNIDLDAIRAASGQAKEFVDAPAFAGVKWRRRDDSGIMIVTSWVARLFGCTTVIHSRGDERWCAFKGQVHNVELAQSWFKYLWDSCKKANTEHARSESRGTFNERETARAVFRLHFCVAVANRLKEKYNAMRTQPGVVSGSTALVVAAWFDAERKEVELWLKEKHPDMAQFAPKPPTQRDSTAAAAGDAAGRRVSLADQIAAHPVARGAIR